MPQRTITFSKNQDGFISRMIEQGAFTDASKIVNVAIKHFQESHEKNDADWDAYLVSVGEEALRSVCDGEGRNISSKEERQNVLDAIRQRALNNA